MIYTKLHTVYYQGRLFEETWRQMWLCKSDIIICYLYFCRAFVAPGQPIAKSYDRHSPCNANVSTSLSSKCNNDPAQGATWTSLPTENRTISTRHINLHRRHLLRRICPEEAVYVSRKQSNWWLTAVCVNSNLPIHLGKPNELRSEANPLRCDKRAIRFHQIVLKTQETFFPTPPISATEEGCGIWSIDTRSPFARCNCHHTILAFRQEILSVALLRLSSLHYDI